MGMVQAQQVLMAQQYSEDDDRNHMHWLVEAFRNHAATFGSMAALCFLVYQASDLPDARDGRPKSGAKKTRSAYGIGDIYLCRVESFRDNRPVPTITGFDAAVEFQPDSRLQLSTREKLYWRLRKSLNLGHGAAAPVTTLLGRARHSAGQRRRTCGFPA